jgi:uncharacterized membrane protein YdfJ with MMPL/SSD domain
VFTGIGLGTIAVVGVSVIGSLTFLPAMLSWLGPGADRGMIPFLGRRRTASKPSKPWAALVARVVRRPAAWGAVGAIAMLALAAPALLELREQVLPATLGKVKGVSWAVTGTTANNYDDLAALHDRTPIVLAVIAVLAFLLLLVGFRSAAVSLISVGLNLLSVAAAIGIVTFIFQDGHSKAC